MTVRELLQQTAEGLEAAGIKNARREAEQIICSALNKNNSYFFSHGSDEAPAELIPVVNRMTVSRAFGMPLQYVTGTAAFMDMELGVDDRVLIPRPETELLAEQAESFLKALCLSGAAENSAGKGLRVLDICTGSGALALYLARRFPEAELTASDISQPALQVALYNAGKYETDMKILRSDLFENIDGSFDLITANPPYIPSELIETLDPEVRDKEPRLALDGGEDGLDIIRRLLAEAPSRLRAGGLLLMEHGHDQGAAARSLALGSGFSSADTLKDLEGRDRILYARS